MTTSRSKRQSIQPTYDHRETGDRFTVETRVNDQLVSTTPTRDPFITHRVTITWRSLLRELLRRHRIEVLVIVGGDPEIVNDVLELDADALVPNSTRQDEFRGQINDALGRL